jgi:hypothetical protein
VHNSRHQSTEECREIEKLVEQFREQQKQQSHHDGMPPHQWEGKQQVAHEGDGEEMEFQNANRAIKVVYGHSDSKSSDNEHRKQLHIIYGGSWDITSRRVVKTLHRAMTAIAPVPRAVPHHTWMETSIAFDASDCPKNMSGVMRTCLSWIQPHPHGAIL